MHSSNSKKNCDICVKPACLYLILGVSDLGFYCNPDISLYSQERIEVLKIDVSLHPQKHIEILDKDAACLRRLHHSRARGISRNLPLDTPLSMLTVPGQPRIISSFSLS